MINRLKELIIENGYPIGNYGIEREMLRVDKNGVLSLKPHPKGLGDKFKNPYITTDFSESQIELITPAFQESTATYNFLNDLYDITVAQIGEEFLWPQSMPCEITDEKQIPIAEFGTEEGAIEARKYREKLLNKYGAKKQLISGIHYNFSFTEELLKGLYAEECNECTYTEFKNKVYLKVARNFLRYRWILIYLLGSTSTLHKTFINKDDCTKCYKEVVKDSFIHKDGISYRNGECGYRNLVDIFPNYNSVKGYTESLYGFIQDNLIESHKELYSQIRLKGVEPQNLLESLKKDGIKYLEYRVIDVNPFEKGGVALGDLEFLEVFNLYLLLKEEKEYNNWQEEALENQNLVAKYGKKEVMLKSNGEEISKEKWGLDILEEISEINKELKLGKEVYISDMVNRLKKPELTYSYRIEERVINQGYIRAYMSLAEKYKEEADKELEEKDTYKKISKWLLN